MEVREDCTPIAHTVTTRMTPALRRAAMRAILMFHNCEGQSHKTVSTDHNFGRERRTEADSNPGPSAHQLNALPLGQTRSREGGRLGLEIVFVTNLPPRLTPALRPDPPTVFLLVRLKHPQTD